MNGKLKYYDEVWDYVCFVSPLSIFPLNTFDFSNEFKQKKEKEKKKLT